eukprot:CAMPEP_0168436240 /NCGR_PEP_ID=MMETSP0228-20121227/40829_1 /TAXON_ID=133427 /ORGANISM="Protoceratium reticulatum, Strain CCCM 535 (=CCMP 1889)" /LENGTH=66 /DNA_ID=CAMNT_0008450441 /DNA_START=79 /DNA_END=277 /DNA_ORIENTATION=-
MATRHRVAVAFVKATPGVAEATFQAVAASHTAAVCQAGRGNRRAFGLVPSQLARSLQKGAATGRQS